MKAKISLFVTALILILPIACYAIFKAPATNAASMQGKAVMMEFSLPLCSECQKLNKILEQVEPQYQDKIYFMKIDASSMDKNTQEAVKAYNVKVVPTCIFVDKTGKMRGRSEGSMSKEELTKVLDEILK